MTGYCSTGQNPQRAVVLMEEEEEEEAYIFTPGMLICKTDKDGWSMARDRVNSCQRTCLKTVPSVHCID